MTPSSCGRSSAAPKATTHFDLPIIDGAVEGTAAAAERIGRALNGLQTGRIHDYALAFLLERGIFLGIVLI